MTGAGTLDVGGATLREAVAATPVAEFTTVRDGRPATVPLTPLYDAERDLVVVTSSPAFAGKARRAAANPRVGMVLHGPDGPLHLAGTATVRDDDLEANAAAVEELIEAEPPSPKRSALLDGAAFMRTRLGLLLFDWYGLRILIEVEPERVVPVDPPNSPGAGAWPAAGIDAAEAADYDRAVAAVVGDDGWPWTWPLGRAAFDGGRLRPPLPPGVSPEDGEPACVLAHWFDPGLDSVAQRLVRGRIRRRDGEVTIDPASSDRRRNATALDSLRFVVDGKRRTRRYFRERGEDYRYVPDLRTLLGWGGDP